MASAIWVGVAALQARRGPLVQRAPDARPRMTRGALQPEDLPAVGEVRVRGVDVGDRRAAGRDRRHVVDERGDHRGRVDRCPAPDRRVRVGDELTRRRLTLRRLRRTPVRRRAACARSTPSSRPRPHRHPAASDRTRFPARRRRGTSRSRAETRGARRLRVTGGATGAFAAAVAGPLPCTKPAPPASASASRGSRLEAHRRSRCRPPEDAPEPPGRHVRMRCPYPGIRSGNARFHAPEDALRAAAVRRLIAPARQAENCRRPGIDLRETRVRRIRDRTSSRKEPPRKPRASGWCSEAAARSVRRTTRARSPRSRTTSAGTRARPTSSSARRPGRPSAHCSDAASRRAISPPSASGASSSTSAGTSSTRSANVRRSRR